MKRGARWVHLVHALPVDMLDDVALRSFDAPSVAPWLWMLVYDALERREPDAWTRAFELLGRAEAMSEEGDDDDDPELMAIIVYMRRTGRKDYVSGQTASTLILFRSPPPDDPDEEFEERLRETAERVVPRNHPCCF